MKEGTVAKSYLDLVEWMIAFIYKTASIKQPNFKSARKKGDNSQVSWSERMAFFRK